MLEEGRLPGPPGRLPAPITLAREVITIFRLHGEDDPRRPRHYPTGKYRFDAPAGEYPVSYGNQDCLGAFAEVYGDTGAIEAAQASRKLSTLTASRPFQFVPLDDPVTLKRLGLDARISVAKQYRRTQQWSLALHGWFPDTDGIRYLSRHAGNQLNYCLFLDRCGADLHLQTLGELQDLRRIVLFAADTYGLVINLRWRS